MVNKKLVKYILYGFCAFTLGATGFGILNDLRRRVKESEIEMTIKGYPISCETISGQNYTNLAAVIKNEEGEYILCEGKQYTSEDLPVLETSALIKSEMNDRDNETVELKGIYRDDKFEVWSVSANGYTLGRK